MKIADIIGSDADGAGQEIAPDNSLLQAIANAFTRSGKVKLPVNQLPDGQSTAAQTPFLSAAGSDEDPVGDGLSNTRTDAPPISQTQLVGQRLCPTPWGQLTGETGVSN